MKSILLILLLPNSKNRFGKKLRKFNMKYILTILFSLLFTVNTFSQTEKKHSFSINLGTNYTYIRGEKNVPLQQCEHNDTVFFAPYKKKNTFGLTFGFSYSKNIYNNIFFSAGLNYTTVKLLQIYDYKIMQQIYPDRKKISYKSYDIYNVIDLPLHLGYKIKNFSISGGANFNLMYIEYIKTINNDYSVEKRYRKTIFLGDIIEIPFISPSFNFNYDFSLFNYDWSVYSSFNLRNYDFNCTQTGLLIKL